ncbi:MAG: ABC transporter substrate binding protein [Bacteroides sp.]|nr:ABC transporter substrate binding protein [Bacteroides sp.]
MKIAPLGLILLVLLHVLGMCSCIRPGIKKKKIVYVNSYHSSFPPSALITRGVVEAFPQDSFELSTFFIDSKRNPSEAYIKKRAEELLDSIREIGPDILIVSDDNALKYLVIPNFKNDPLPIVFCGVNWTVEKYDLSFINITGVLEILPVEDLIQTLKPYYPEMKNLLVLNENTTTSRKTQALLDTLLGNLGMDVTQALVDDFEGWKSVFVEANKNVDIIYMQTRGAISGWDHDEAIRHIDQYINIPVVTCEEFMMPYAVFGLTQLSEEQGEIAAQLAHEILRGARPKDIPLTKNSESKIWINPRLAEKINFKTDKVMLDRANLNSY